MPILERVALRVLHQLHINTLKAENISLRSSKCRKYKCKIKADNITSKSSGRSFQWKAWLLA
jgi:hypothetical protein